MPPPLSSADMEREVAAVRLAESGKLEEALSEFKAISALYPEYAGGFNNMAQAQRLLKQNADAMASLDSAIRLAGADKFTERQALTQRGSLHVLAGDEDAARRDFEAAAALGSDIAAKEAARLNPYARMCNAMLKEVFEKYSWSQETPSS